MSLSLEFQSRSKQALLCFCFLFAVAIIFFSGYYGHRNFVNPNHYFNLTKVHIMLTRASGPHLKSKNRSEFKKSDPKLLIILMWTNFYAKEDELNHEARRWGDSNCFTHAELTFNRTRLKDAAAIVFYQDELKVNDMPSSRTPQQLWVLLSQESPIYTDFKNLAVFDNLFNVTMSYRLDADLYAPYGKMMKLKRPLSKKEDIIINNMTLASFIKKKSKLVTVVVSHCSTQSKREKIMELMKPNIDIYGACGKHVCPRIADMKKACEFWGSISRDYKFYFAAENSICHDYITEKFWRPLEIGVVPVVYGGGNYRAVAPPSSYIDSRDFESPEELIEFLKFLDNNTDEYAKYFEWRRRYEVRSTESGHIWCDLVKYLRNLPHVKPRFHSHVGKWWDTKANNTKGGRMENACSEPFWTLTKNDGRRRLSFGKRYKNKGKKGTFEQFRDVLLI